MTRSFLGQPIRTRLFPPVRTLHHPPLRRVRTLPRFSVLRYCRHIWNEMEVADSSPFTEVSNHVRLLQNQLQGACRVVENELSSVTPYFEPERHWKIGPVRYPPVSWELYKHVSTIVLGKLLCPTNSRDPVLLLFERGSALNRMMGHEIQYTGADMAAEAARGSVRPSVRSQSQDRSRPAVTGENQPSSRQRNRNSYRRFRSENKRIFFRR